MVELSLLDCMMLGVLMSFLATHTHTFLSSDLKWVNFDLITGASEAFSLYSPVALVGLATNLGRELACVCVTAIVSVT